MNVSMVGCMDKNDSFPARGERVAAWVHRYMADNGLSVGELAFRAAVDKRDLRRLLNPPHNCGWRLEDSLAAFFGWDFTEAVMTPVHGADPTTARERELETRLSQAAALHARIERERALRTAAAPRLALVAGEAAVHGSPSRGGGRSFDPKTPEGGMK
jgi:hypothetical protein